VLWRVCCPASVAGSFLSVVPVCLASLSAYGVWSCAAVVKQSGLVFCSVVVGLAGLQSVCRAGLLVLPVVAGGFGLLAVGCGQSGGVGFFPVVRQCGVAGCSDSGQNVLYPMPNKPVKGTARRSGWQSQFFSQVSGFALGYQRAAPYRNVGLSKDKI